MSVECFKNFKQLFFKNHFVIHPFLFALDSICLVVTFLKHLDLPFVSKGSFSELSMIGLIKIFIHFLLRFSLLLHSLFNASLLLGAHLKNKPDSYFSSKVEVLSCTQSFDKVKQEFHWFFTDNASIKCISLLHSLHYKNEMYCTQFTTTLHLKNGKKIL